MQFTFECPDCHRVHAEPTSASYVLRVQCAFCALVAEMDEARCPDGERELSAAA